jgi:hypothetical protein
MVRAHLRRAEWRPDGKVVLTVEWRGWFSLPEHRSYLGYDQTWQRLDTFRNDYILISGREWQGVRSLFWDAHTARRQQEHREDTKNTVPDLAP